MKTVLIFLAEGFEEMEAVVPMDLLRRVGIEVNFISTTEFMQVQGAHSIYMRADALFQESALLSADGIILPGGMPGTLNLLAHEGLRRLILLFHREEKPICAICAAPMILGKLGILAGRTATIYPGMEEHLVGAKHSTAQVCKDGHIITSRGPGTAIPFALALAAIFAGEDAAEKLKRDIIFQES